MQTIITICFASDDNYAPYMGMAIFSILRNANPNDKFRFYVLDNKISHRNKQKIESLKKHRPFQITWLTLDISLFQKCDTKHANWTLSIFGRYLIPKLIPADKVLYLDSDIIVNGSLKELFDIDINGYYALAVKDLYLDIYKEHKELIGMGNNRIYFNAGVVLFNNKLCIDNNISQKFYFYFTENKNKLKFHDQDILKIFKFVNFLIYGIIKIWIFS